MDGSTDLLRFDVSDPAQVSLLDTLELGQNESVVIADDAIVVLGNNRFQLRDAADPQTVLSETTLASGTFASRAAVHENILTLAESGETGGNGIEQFDISDPAAPVLVRELVPMEFFFVAETVTDGERLFFDETFGEFGHCGSQIHAVDLGGDTPQQATTFDPANCVTELELADDTLYVAGRSGLQLYNVSDPANPTLSGEFRHPVDFHGVEGVAVQEGIGYVLAGEGRSFDVATVDLSQPDNPQPGERLTVGTETLQELFITGNTLIASVWMGGLNTLDISDPAAPQLLYQAASGELLTGDFFAMAVGENVVYSPIVGENLVGAVGAIDLSDPANPTVAATVETGAPQVVSLALDGDTLYALTQGEVAELHVFDVSQPLELTPTATLELPEYVSELALAGDTLFAICDGFNCQNLYGVDVSDPQNPTILGPWAMPFGAVETAADGQGIIYLITPVEGIWVLNATDPANPYLAGRLQIAGGFARLKLVEDTIYAAAFDAGLYVIQAD
jgi:hypothetical protein